jgi:hypothetical protein
MIRMTALLFSWSYGGDDYIDRLRTAATNEPIVYPPGDTWAWRTTAERYRQEKSPD